MDTSFQFSLKGADSLGASAKGAGGGRGGSAGCEPRTQGTYESPRASVRELSWLNHPDPNHWGPSFTDVCLKMG